MSIESIESVAGTASIYLFGPKMSTWCKMCLEADHTDHTAPGLCANHGSRTRSERFFSFGEDSDSGKLFFPAVIGLLVVYVRFCVFELMACLKCLSQNLAAFCQIDAMLIVGKLLRDMQENTH